MPESAAGSIAFSGVGLHRLQSNVRVHHAVPGRTRLRLDPLRGRRDLLGALARRLAARVGIIDVRASAASGALLVRHDKQLTSDAIASIVREIWRHGLAAPVAAAQAETQAKPWHALPPQTVALAFASASGLSDAKAYERLTRIGENRLAEPTPPSMAALLVDQFKSVPVALLGGSAVLSITTGGVV